MSDEPPDRMAHARAIGRSFASCRPSQGEVLRRDDRAFDLILTKKYMKVVRLLMIEFGCGICAAKASVARARISIREALGEKHEDQIAKTLCQLDSMIEHNAEPSDRLAAIKTKIDLLGLAVPKPSSDTNVNVNVENKTIYDLKHVDAMKNPELRARTLQLENDIANLSTEPE